jgi:hypothetical protein
MNLKDLCMQNMVEMIKNMPPMMKEEIIGVSLKAIKEEARLEARLEAMKEFRRSSTIVDDVTDRLVVSHKTGQDWGRPEYTKDIDDELYNTFVDIAEGFVNKNYEKLVFDERPMHNRQNAVFYGFDSDESEDDSDY